MTGQEMNQKLLVEQLSLVVRIAQSSKLKRLLHHPLNYARTVLLRKWLPKIGNKERDKRAQLFFGETMMITLPAATDIYLTGGKSHPSEIRLALFIIKQVGIGNTFLDIGAHFGYFSLLAARIVGKSGRVIAYEPGQKTYRILQQNAATRSNISAIQNAVSNTVGQLTFYEFPTLYSEYNSLAIAQFKTEDWYQSLKVEQTIVPTTTIDTLFLEQGIIPQFIKIDVEGAELQVIEGGQQLFQQQAPIVVMEYLEPKRKNETHQQALALMKTWGYSSYLINEEGQLTPIDNLEEHLLKHKLESENVVFRKAIRKPKSHQNRSRL